MKLRFCLALPVLLAGCADAPPGDTADICSVFQEKGGWYASARASARRWGAPVPLMMAIIRHESAFVDDARPPRVRVLGVPLWRPSSAYGYSQATDPAWAAYVGQSGNSGAERDDFADAVDFVGWYARHSAAKLGVGMDDGYNHYLAYHEGPGGFRRGTWRAKPWLQEAARQVAATASRYRRRLGACLAELERSAS